VANEDQDEGASSATNLPKGGLYGGPYDTSTIDDPNTLALLMGYRWTTSDYGDQPATTITYAFPTQTSDYTSTPDYPGTAYLTGFTEATATQQAAVVTALDLVSSYTELTFVPAASADDAAIRVANTTNGTSSVGYFPYSGGLAAGDVFLNTNGVVPPQYFGSDGFLTVTHELGHALGLTHGDGDNGFPALQPQYTDNEFTVMTYASYLYSPAGQVTTAWEGSAPQSYMMFDIAALQVMYGANFSKVGTTATYTWDATTGQEYINGLPAPDTGVSSTGKIFATVWTQGATTTYDLSNFSGNQVDDMRPGHWLDFSQSQLADLNNQVPAGTPQYQAQGNIYNALLYHGDTRSEISTLITGSGNDTVWGNDVNDTINTGAGNDVIHAGSANDTITGGPGADTIDFGTGHSVALDTLVDMNGDIYNDIGFTNALDIEGVSIDRAGFDISIMANEAAFSADGSSFELFDPSFGAGDFMVVDRGFGANAHTTISFANYMPPLVEGTSVNPAAINGIVNPAFLTGDGSIDFSLNLKQAVSFFDNTLGYYTIGADGTISNVHILFSDTLNVPANQQTVDLGVPGSGQSIGFFLIQNGANIYGNLPANLYFVQPGTNNLANVNEGAPPVLYSATLGQLTAAEIFHSTAGLNPGGTVQVLSGTTPGGQELVIGFEDTQKADNDFNDVVVSIHTSSHGYLIG
jgi:Ca2+-binding RTX toxin-like protein